MVSLQDVYVGCTVFSMGITALDFLGILGHQSDGDDAGGDADGGDFGESGDHAGDFDAGDSVGGDHFDSADSDGVDHADAADSADDGSDAADSHSTHGQGGVAILSVLSYLRSLVYFCLGFGPTGWVAMATGRTTMVSLMWALPAGAVAFVLARAFFRFQRSDMDSSLGIEDLLFQQATVTVPLSDSTMGKVRVRIGMNITEQYALAATPNTTFAKGDLVRVTNVTDEYVQVEDEMDGKE